MKKAKLLLSMLLLVCCFGFNSVNVSAHEHVEVSVFNPNEEVMVYEEEQQIMPRARVCICGMGVLVETKSYGQWGTPVEQKCIHDIYGTDLVYKRVVTIGKKCNYCGRLYTDSTTTETRIECHGYHA